MRQFKGELHFGRTYGREDGKRIDYFRLELIDEKSWTGVITVEIPADKIADFISNSPVKVDYKTFDSQVLGCQAQNKEIVLNVPQMIGKDKIALRKLREAIAAHEKDGWRGNDEDAHNHHRYAGVSTRKGWVMYRIGFNRWVKEDGTPVERPR